MFLILSQTEVLGFDLIAGKTLCFVEWSDKKTRIRTVYADTYTASVFYLLSEDFLEEATNNPSYE